jgi:hypothetical protein
MKTQIKMMGSMLLVLLSLTVTPVLLKAQAPAVKNVVLVHGAFADGSGWRGVYNILVKKRV